MENHDQPQGMQYTTVMVPMLVPTPSQKPEVQEVKGSEAGSVLTGVFWAILLLLAFWFVTGGHEVMK